MAQKKTDNTGFTNKIKTYLDERAAADELFAAAYAKPGKTIDDCATYIISQVQATKRTAFADEEIYSIAVHYYDEDDIKVGKPSDCDVKWSSEYLTDEEKEAARQNEMQDIRTETRKQVKDAIKATRKPAKKTTKPSAKQAVEQTSLF